MTVKFYNTGIGAQVLCLSDRTEIYILHYAMDVKLVAIKYQFIFV